MADNGYQQNQYQSPMPMPINQVQSAYQNPYFDPYGALRQFMPQQQNPQNQQPLQQAPQIAKPGFIYRPVGGVEEVKALNIDWDGTMYILEDGTNGILYKKQYADGAVKMDAYQKVIVPEPVPVTYVTTESFEELRQQLADIQSMLAKDKETKPVSTRATKGSD